MTSTALPPAAQHMHMVTGVGVCLGFGSRRLLSLQSVALFGWVVSSFAGQQGSCGQWGLESPLAHMHHSAIQINPCPAKLAGRRLQRLLLDPLPSQEAWSTPCCARAALDVIPLAIPISLYPYIPTSLPLLFLSCSLSSPLKPACSGCPSRAPSSPEGFRGFSCPA